MKRLGITIILKSSCLLDFLTCDGKIISNILDLGGNSDLVFVKEGIFNSKNRVHDSKILVESSHCTSVQVYE